MEHLRYISSDLRCDVTAWPRTVTKHCQYKLHTDINQSFAGALLSELLFWKIPQHVLTSQILNVLLTLGHLFQLSSNIFFILLISALCPFLSYIIYLLYYLVQFLNWTKYIFRVFFLLLFYFSFFVFSRKWSYAHSIYLLVTGLVIISNWFSPKFYSMIGSFSSWL